MHSLSRRHARSHRKRFAAQKRYLHATAKAVGLAIKLRRFGRERSSGQWIHSR